MNKVLVDRGLLELLRNFTYLHDDVCADVCIADALRVNIDKALAAQPAEAEGVDFGFDDRSVKVSQEAYSIFLEREQHHLAALSAVTAERDRLQAALSAPDTITAEPAGDYDNLRKQFQSLRMLANSNAKMVHYWRAQCDRETREALLANAASVNAERDTNSMLTDALLTAERERDQLRAEVDALRKDAERYRWLRDPYSGAEHVIYYSRGDYGRGLMSGSMLDAAIDAALAAKEA